MSRKRGLRVVERHTYTTAAGGGTEYRLTSGQLLRLEPRRDCVVVGWTTTEPFAQVAPKLAALAETAVAVFIASDGDGRVVTDRGAELELQMLTRPLDLVRIDRVSDSVVWEAKDSDVTELSVAAESWAEAQRVAKQIGAAAIGSAVISLTNRDSP